MIVTIKEVQTKSNNIRLKLANKESFVINELTQKRASPTYVVSTYPLSYFS